MDDKSFFHFFLRQQLRYEKLYFDGEIPITKLSINPFVHIMTHKDEKCYALGKVGKYLKVSEWITRLKNYVTECYIGPHIENAF